MTISWFPTRPVKNAKARCALPWDAGNYTRVYIQSKPVDSEMSLTTVVWEGEFGRGDCDITFDAAGVFTLRVEQYNKLPDYEGGGWAGAGWNVDMELAVTRTYDVSVGQRLTHRIGWSPDACTLVLYCWDEAIYPTTAFEYGETTPAVIDPTSVSAQRFMEESIQPWVDDLRTRLPKSAQTVLGWNIRQSEAVGVWPQAESLDYVDLPVLLYWCVAVQLKNHVDNDTVHATVSADEQARDFTPLIQAPPNVSSTGAAWTGLDPKTVKLLYDGWQLHVKSYGKLGEGSGKYHKTANDEATLMCPSPTDQNSMLVALGELIYSMDKHLLSDNVHNATSVTDFAAWNARGLPIFKLNYFPFWYRGLWWASNMVGVMRMHYEWAKAVHQSKLEAQVGVSVEGNISALASLGGFA